MKKTQKQYMDKYRSNKALIQLHTNPNIKREFHMICTYRGWKMKDALEKLIVEFNKKYEVKVLE